MAYVHCHSCDWAQDDFWEFRVKWGKLFRWRYRPFGYNPLSLILEDIAENYFPRYIGMDSNWMEENGYTQPKGQTKGIHSWRMMFKHGIWRHFRRLFTQVWWTYGSWQRAVKENGGKWPACPKCGKHELDID